MLTPNNTSRKQKVNTMSQYQLTTPRFQKANKNLLKSLHTKLNIDKSKLSNNDLLQFMSQAFFDKPFEELRATLLSNELPAKVVPKPTISDIPLVILAHYGSESVLIVKGEYQVSRAIGTDMEISAQEIRNQADNMARVLNSHVEQAYLPVILAEDWEYEDIVKLATDMGYGMVAETIFDLLENYDIKIFINGIHTGYQPNDQWKSEMASEYDADDKDNDARDHMIWSPEIHTNQSDYFQEFYFSFNELCNATYTKTGWIVPFHNTSVIVSFFREQN